MKSHTHSDATAPAPSRLAKLRASKLGGRLGLAAFLFFFLKGLAWLAIPALAWSQIK